MRLILSLLLLGSTFACRHGSSAYRYDSGNFSVTRKPATYITLDRSSLITPSNGAETLPFELDNFLDSPSADSKEILATFIPAIEGAGGEVQIKLKAIDKRVSCDVQLIARFDASAPVKSEKIVGFADGPNAIQREFTNSCIGQEPAQAHNWGVISFFVEHKPETLHLIKFSYVTPKPVDADSVRKLASISMKFVDNVLEVNGVQADFSVTPYLFDVFILHSKPDAAYVYRLDLEPLGRGFQWNLNDQKFSYKRRLKKSEMSEGIGQTPSGEPVMSKLTETSWSAYQEAE